MLYFVNYKIRRIDQTLSSLFWKDQKVSGRNFVFCTIDEIKYARYGQLLTWFYIYICMCINNIIHVNMSFIIFIFLNIFYYFMYTREYWCLNVTKMTNAGTQSKLVCTYICHVACPSINVPVYTLEIKCMIIYVCVCYLM